MLKQASSLVWLSLVVYVNLYCTLKKLEILDDTYWIWLMFKKWCRNFINWLDSKRTFSLKENIDRIFCNRNRKLLFCMQIDQFHRNIRKGKERVYITSRSRHQNEALHSIFSPFPWGNTGLVWNVRTPVWSVRSLQLMRPHHPRKFKKSLTSFLLINRFCSCI